MDPVSTPPSSLTPVKLASVIRFHLGELSARNGHHEFESLCRHLARARIYRNILPATGPVSAGGDQGRDFETYSAGVAVSLFDRNVSDGKTVFLCSLEKKIERKIKADVDATVEEATQAIRSAFEFKEELDSAIDPDLIPDDMLRTFREVFRTTYLRSWDLDVHSAAVDGSALEGFLIDRYGLRSDDVDHTDIFGWKTLEEGEPPHEPDGR